MTDTNKIQKNAHRKGVKSQARTSFSVPTHYINTYNHSYPAPLVTKPLIKFGFNNITEEPGSNKFHEGDCETNGCHFLCDVCPYEVVAVG